jgi:phospholipid/cholesterol/gamma-HCH transport system ATP-binding protein
MSDAIIEAHELTIGFPTLKLFQDESFEVQRGEIVAIMGDSGSGKSTLLRCLIGLDAPIAGTITVNGEAPNVDIGRPEIGVGFQSGALFGSMTVRENLRLALSAWTDLPLKDVDHLVYTKLALVGVEGVIDRLPSEISGGQVKRVAIARSLMLDPDLIFLDEPFAGLDPITGRELEVLLQRLNQALGVTVVLVSHLVERVIRIADNCLLISTDKRAIVARGKPCDLRDKPPNEIAASFFGVEEAA